MDMLRRFFGGGEERQPQPAAPAPHARRGPARSADEQAVERYRYMLQTAPPETIERAHEEAFARLTPEQRRMALDELSKTTPPEERAGATDDPRGLARMATRAEMRQPGTLERAFGGRGGGMGGMGGGMGMGGMIAGGLLASIAGSFIGTAIAQQFFDNDPGFGDGMPGEEFADPGAEPGMETLAAEDPALNDPGLADMGFEEDFGDEFV